MLWTDSERARLRELRPHMALKQIAAELGRPLGSVAHESARMKLFRPRGTSWTPEEMDRIAAWWPDYSASEIGEKLGRSRNAVIGVIHRVREKLELQHKTSAHPLRLPRKPQPPRRINASKPDPQVPKPHPMMQCPCQLVELEEDNCKWPHGDPSRDGFYFCGALTANGFPYCEKHHAIAHERERRFVKRH